MNPWIIIAILIGFFVLVFIVIYNGLVQKRNRIENSFGGIDAQLKKRYDLIPALVSTIKNYSKHENETLSAIAELRSQAMKSGVGTDERISLENRIQSALGKIMVSVEDYPDLKADENFMQLQRTLNEIEEQISAARRSFNASVTNYNNAVEMFPSNLVAGAMGFRRRAVFEIVEEQRTAPNVSELFES